MCPLGHPKIIILRRVGWCKFRLYFQPCFHISSFLVYPDCLASFIYSTAKEFVIEIGLEHAVTGMPFRHGLVCLHGLHMSAARHAHEFRASFFFFDVTEALLADTNHLVTLYSFHTRFGGASFPAHNHLRVYIHANMRRNYHNNILLSNIRTCHFDKIRSSSMDLIGYCNRWKDQTP